MTDFAGGAIVRYASPWDAVNQVFTATTAMAPAVVTPTNGHACWTGGSGNYATGGCEHFGVSLSANPTSSVYHWLVADPAHPGTLIQSPTKVTVPASTWVVSPPPVPGPPLVQAVVPAVPPEIGLQFGDATWVKVFVRESPNPADLNHLVSEDPAVPESPAEVEMEWALIQTGPGALNELAIEAQVAPDTESVTRRYEYYKYTGVYVLESHEALCIDPNCAVPAASELGNYLGAEIGAVNLGLVSTTTTTTVTTTTTTTTSTTTAPVTTSTTTTTTLPTRPPRRSSRVLRSAGRR